jgi:hypothetical protein
MRNNKIQEENPQLKQTLKSNTTQKNLAELDPRQLILLPKKTSQTQSKKRNKIASYSNISICGLGDDLIDHLYSKNSEYIKLMSSASENILKLHPKDGFTVSDLAISLNAIFTLNPNRSSTRYLKEKCDNALDGLSRILEIGFRFRTPAEKASDDINNFMEREFRSGGEIIDDPRILQFHFYNLFANQIRNYLSVKTFNYAYKSGEYLFGNFDQEWVSEFQKKHEAFIGNFLQEMFDECQSRMPETSLESFKEECLPQLQKIEKLTAIEKSKPLQSIEEEDRYFSNALRNLSANREKPEEEPSILYSKNSEREILEDEKSQDDAIEVRKPTFSASRLIGSSSEKYK